MVEKDTPEIVPLEKEFEVEEYIMGSELLDDDCWIRDKKEMDEDDELSQKSVRNEHLPRGNSGNKFGRTLVSFFWLMDMPIME